MADFVYGTGSTDIGRNGRIGPRFNPQNDKYWAQPAVAYDSRPLPEVHPDHVCRPVAVDAYGRPIPGVVVLSNDQRITQTEYVAESVYSSKTHPNHNRADRDRLDCDDGKGKPLFSPTRQQAVMPHKVNEFISEVSSGPRAGGFPSGMFQRRAAAASAAQNRQFRWEEAPPPARTYEPSTMTRPSSDVGALAEYVREAARPTAGRLTAAPTGNKEEQRRYKDNAPATGTMRVDPVLPSIDHKAAALKYNGALVN